MTDPQALKRRIRAQAHEGTVGILPVVGNVDLRAAVNQRAGQVFDIRRIALIVRQNGMRVGCREQRLPDRALQGGIRRVRQDMDPRPQLAQLLAQRNGVSPDSTAGVDIAINYNTH